MSSMEFEILGDVAIKVTITEIDGNLEFNVRVLQEGDAGYTGQIGEINGLFFDMAGDVSDIATISATSSDGETLAMDVDEASVSNLGGGVNVNGEVVKEAGKFDAGILLDKTGLGNGDLQEITFTLDADTDLSLTDVALQDFAVRLTSVGEPDGDRNGSLKLGGTAPEEPNEPSPEINTAVNDVIMVFEDATFDDFMFESFQTGGPTLLSNDVTDSDAGTLAYAGQVTSVQGTAVETDFVIVSGSNGGLLKVFPDGSVDFSANGEFDALDDFQEETTDFTYGIEGGSSATLTVNVIGLNNMGPEPGGPGTDPDPLPSDGLGDFI